VKLSSRVLYGVRAMAELAGAYGSGPVSLGEVAEAERISFAYLEQLMAALRRAGLVESTRGMRGGYELAREPSAVTVGEIVRALEGPISLVECASETDGAGRCERELTCATRMVWQRMQDSITKVLDSITLAELCRGSDTVGAPGRATPEGNSSAGGDACAS